MNRVKKIVRDCGPWKGQNTVVVILDTGVEPHPELEGRILYFRDFVNGYLDIYDDNGHGTHVCGIVAGSGIGMAPQCKLIVLKVLDASGNGCVENCMKAFRWILENQEKELINAFKKAYILENGCCSISEQTAISMIVSLGLYDDIEPLKQQLREEVEKYDYHIHCGMLGIQYLFNALDICGLSEYGVRMITVEGFPSYTDWIKDGATTLYEHWNKAESNNHHMYSCILAWFNKTLAGLRLDDKINAYKHAVISPVFVPQLENCSGKYKTTNGEYLISWKRTDSENVLLEFTIPQGCTAELKLNGYNSIENSAYEKFDSGSYSILCVKI